MLKYLFFITGVAILFTCCNNQVAGDVSSQQPGTDSTKSLSAKQAVVSGVDTSTTSLVDTATYITATLGNIIRIDSVTAHLRRDSFDLEGLSTEGGEIIVARDSNNGFAKLYGTVFGELGKMDFVFYLSPTQQTMPQCVMSKTYSYDKPMYEKGSKIKEVNTTYEIFNGKQLVAILNGKKKLIPTTSGKMIEQEKETRQFFEQCAAQAKKQ